jgi:hypothetical protein
MSDNDRTKEVRGQTLGKEKRNQKRIVTEPSDNQNEDRTKEVRGQTLGKEERNQKRVEP